MKTSKKNIIGIRQFLCDYILTKKDSDKFTGDLTITHDEMNLYLYMNGYTSPNRVSFNSVKKTDILTGDIILVKDEIGKVIPYYNPRKMQTNKLMEELNSSENRKIMLKARRENLSNLGCVETKRGDIIEKSLIDEKEYIITNKLNRNKRLAHENCRKMRGMVGLK